MDKSQRKKKLAPNIFAKSCPQPSIPWWCPRRQKQQPVGFFRPREGWLFVTCTLRGNRILEIISRKNLAPISAPFCNFKSEKCVRFFAENLARDVHLHVQVLAMVGFCDRMAPRNLLGPWQQTAEAHWPRLASRCRARVYGYPAPLNPWHWTDFEGREKSPVLSKHRHPQAPESEFRQI